MKNKFSIYLIIAFLSMMSVSNGFQYTVENTGAGVFANGVTDQQGKLVSGSQGSVAFGYFDSDSAVTTAKSAADLLDNDWHVFGDSEGDSETTFYNNTPLNGSFSSQYDIPDLADFDTKNIYVVIGNASSLTASGEFFVYKFDATFDDSSFLPRVLNLDTATAGSILIGSLGPAQAISVAGTPSQPTLQMDSIVAPDNDGDGIPDSTDPDDDNDGVADVDDDFPLDPTKVYGVITREDGINIQGDQASSPTSRKVRFRKSASGDDYSGFLASADGRKILGRFEGIVLKETRDFSARMIFGNTNYALKGRINKKGRYSKVITPEKGKDVTVNLRLVKTESGNYKLRGTVQRGKKTAVVVVVKSGQVDSLAGRYTLLIPGEEAASTKPQGHGYGAMQVMSGGTAKLTGLLGDGSKWTAECNVTSDGEMPLFSTLYLDDKGWVGGLVSFRDIEGVSDCDGTVHWRKPGNKKNRFSLVRDLIGSRYKREGVIAGDPATKPNVMADVGAGDGDASQAWELAWNAGNKKRLVYTGSGGAKLIVRRKKGLTEFYLTDPQLGQTKVGDGVVFQKQDIAAGTYYTEGKTRRSLVITPVE